MKMYRSYRFQTRVMLLITSLIFTANSCIKNALDEETSPPEIIVPDSIDSTIVTIDSTFFATTSFMLKTWMGEYVGYDLMQGKMSAIRRQILFSPEGFYDNHVQGANFTEEDSIIEYKEFEHEHGIFTFDSVRQVMTYTVEYDSLLNFATDQMIFYPGKMIQGTGLVQTYEENVHFSLIREGRRDWIRKDDNLVSLEDHSNQLIYIMKSQQ